LHGMFADEQYPTLSGTNTARDFVEFPSQFNEHWATNPKVFANYAKNYQTGKPMPQPLVDKMKKAGMFNKGYDMTELVSAALLDMNWHMLGAAAPLQDADTFEAAALKKDGVDLSYVPPRYRSSYFQHIWGNGYAAGYYAYLWTEMLADDAFVDFQENGGLTRANGDRFRAMVLSRGNTEGRTEKVGRHGGMKHETGRHHAGPFFMGALQGTDRPVRCCVICAARTDTERME